MQSSETRLSTICPSQTLADIHPHKRENLEPEGGHDPGGEWSVPAVGAMSTSSDVKHTLEHASSSTIPPPSRRLGYAAQSEVVMVSC